MSSAGKYVIMKDPNRAVIRLYAVPVDAFSGDEGGDGDDDEDGGAVERGDDDDDFAVEEEDDEDDTPLGPERQFTAGPENAAGGAAP